jgi:hypothetical protein
MDICHATGPSRVMKSRPPVPQRICMFGREVCTGKRPRATEERTRGITPHVRTKQHALR